MFEGKFKEYRSNVPTMLALMTGICSVYATIIIGLMPTPGTPPNIRMIYSSALLPTGLNALIYTGLSLSMYTTTGQGWVRRSACTRVWLGEVMIRIESRNRLTRDEFLDRHVTCFEVFKFRHWDLILRFKVSEEVLNSDSDETIQNQC